MKSILPYALVIQKQLNSYFHVTCGNVDKIEKERIKAIFTSTKIIKRTSLEEVEIKFTFSNNPTVITSDFLSEVFFYAC